MEREAFAFAVAQKVMQLSHTAIFCVCVRCLWLRPGRTEIVKHTGVFLHLQEFKHKTPAGVNKVLQSVSVALIFLFPVNWTLKLTT